jgi:hypothetical protein
MGRILRRRLQRCHDDLLNLIGRDRRRAPRTRLVDQTIQAGLDKPAPPFT